MTVLKKGSEGSLVQVVQLSLIRSGFLSGDADGKFGEKTEKALKAFQKDYSLKITGIADEETVKELERFIKGYHIKEIVKGDTFWSIAAMTGASVAAIETANPGIAPENLIIGEKITVPYGFKLIPTDIEYSSYLVSLLIEGLLARYPFIKSEVLGKSVTGAEIPVIIAGKGKNAIFVNAGFHANEWLNIPVVLKFSEEYLYAVSRNKIFEGINARRLFNATTMFLAPIINPDGTDLVTKALQKGFHYEKAKKIASAFPSIPFPAGWKANIVGTDLNLLFPACWEKAKEIKYSLGFNKPAPRDFVGETPLFAPEALAVYNYTLKNNFKLALAYHSQGSVIYWKFLDFLPPQSEKIGNILSLASGYPLEITPPNSSYAGYKDWFIQNFNRPAYTIETGRGTNPLPLSQFNKIYSENKPLIAAALRAAAKI